jgi:hypothetical protein
VVAYADDIAISVTAKADIAKVMDLLSNYGRAMAAHMNTSKSKALAVGSCDTSEGIMDIPYHQDVTMLGFRFPSMVAPSSNLTRAMAVRKAKA